MVNSSLTILEGSTLVLHCSTQGSPAPTLTWLKASLAKPDDKTGVQYDQHTNKLVTQEKCTLLIQQSKREDSAVYTLTASNSLGKASKDITLTVLGENTLLIISRVM